MTALAVYDQPRTPEDRYRYASSLAEARTLPAELRGSVSDVLLRIEYGIAVGIPPVSAISCVHVIEGKPTASAGLLSGLLRTAGRLRVGTTPDPTYPGEVAAWATYVRHDDPDHEYRVDWTIDRAVIAGLVTTKDGKVSAAKARSAWATYRAAMLKARCVSEIARDAAEDVILGIRYTPDELGAQVNEAGDVIEGEVVPNAPRPDPRPAPESGPYAPPAPAAPPVVDAVTVEAVDAYLDTILAAWDDADADALRGCAAAARDLFPAEQSPVPHPVTGEEIGVGALLREVFGYITSGVRPPGADTLPDTGPTEPAPAARRPDAPLDRGPVPADEDPWAGPYTTDPTLDPATRQEPSA